MRLSEVLRINPKNSEKVLFILSSVVVVMVVGLSRIVACGTWNYSWYALRRVFLKDTNPHLREFWRKPQKTPND